MDTRTVSRRGSIRPVTRAHDGIRMGGMGKLVCPCTTGTGNLRSSLAPLAYGTHFEKPQKVSWTRVTQQNLHERGRRLRLGEMKDGLPLFVTGDRLVDLMIDIDPYRPVGTFCNPKHRLA